MASDHSAVAGPGVYAPALARNLARSALGRRSRRWPSRVTAPRTAQMFLLPARIRSNATPAYELTLPAASDGSGWSISRDGDRRVATWQIRIDDSWDEYADWVRPRLLKEFDSVNEGDTLRLEFAKSL